MSKHLVIALGIHDEARARLDPITENPRKYSASEHQAARRAMETAYVSLAIAARSTADRLHRLAVEATRTDSTSSKVRAARDQLVSLCLSLGSTTPEVPAWPVGATVFLTGPRRPSLPLGPYTVIESQHAHLTRITNGHVETSVPHASLSLDGDT